MTSDAIPAGHATGGPTPGTPAADAVHRFRDAVRASGLEGADLVASLDHYLIEHIVTAALEHRHDEAFGAISRALIGACNDLTEREIAYTLLAAP